MVRIRHLALVVAYVALALGSARWAARQPDAWPPQALLILCSIPIMWLLIAGPLLVLGWLASKLQPPQLAHAPHPAPSPQPWDIPGSLAGLPESALRAFAARCARRVQPLTLPMTIEARRAVEGAIAAAEAWAAGRGPGAAGRAEAFARVARAISEAWTKGDDVPRFLPARLVAEVAALAVAEGPDVFLAWDPDGMGFDPEPGGPFVAAASAAKGAMEIMHFMRLNFGEWIPARVRALAPAEAWGGRGPGVEDDRRPEPGMLPWSALVEDVRRLRELALGGAREPGRPVDPSPAGPLGPLWEDGEPAWFAALSRAMREDETA